MATPTLLVGDLGGTNARFALAHADKSGFADLLALPCAEFVTADAAINQYLEQADAPAPDAIVFAVAGPVVDGTVRFMNIDWRLDTRDLEARFPSARVSLINDFGAIAYSIPQLGDSDVETIGSAALALPARGDFTVAVLGPGTGLGTAGLMRRDGVLHPIVGEGGHPGFAPESEEQIALLRQLRKRFERVSDERLLSGAGIENIHLAVQAENGIDPTATPAEQIFRRAIEEEDELATKTVHHFFEVLGQVAGNHALAFGAWDGVYIAGGIVPRYSELLKASRFRAGFESKGRYRTLMERIPTFLITHPQPGLLGASYLARMLVTTPGQG